MKNNIIIVLSALSIALLASCLSADKLTRKALAKNRAVVAEITRAEFPCVVVKEDTTMRTDTLYDIIEVQCPDTIAYRVDSFETVTAVRVPVYIKVPVASAVQTVTITKTIEDSAKIYAIQSQLDKATKDNERLQDKVGRKNKVLLWLAIILAVACGFIFLKIKRVL